MQVTSHTRVEIITIGNELLYGFTQDTNAQWLSLKVSEAGFHVIHKTTVGDNRHHIIDALQRAEQRADVILITGGLGPTSDDVTKACLADFFKCGVALHEEALNDVKRLFHARKRILTAADRQQAFLPICCTKITNTLGTAPGMWFKKNKKIVVAMPGVPSEMKKMAWESIIPRLQNTFETHSIQHFTIHTVGIGESSLAEKISSWENQLPKHIQPAYLPHMGEVTVRLAGTGSNPEDVKAELTTWGHKLEPLVGKYIYGYGSNSLAAAIGEQLQRKNLTIGTAESCTGGHLSHCITSIPGSSAYYAGGVIAYDNMVKRNLLGVPANILEKEGAVSRSVVTAMAHSVRNLFNTNIGIATSGVAGPYGGTPEKPMGTVWLALCDDKITVAKKYTLGKNRMMNIQRASTIALNMIRKNLMGILVEE